MAKLGRPRTPLLSTERITKAALDLVCSAGDFTMPGIAQKLKVRPSSLYNHVRGRDEVVELLREHAMSEVALPPDDPDGPGGLDGGAGARGASEPTSRLILDLGRAGGRHGWDAAHHDDLEQRLADLAAAVAGRCGGAPRR